MNAATPAPAEERGTPTPLWVVCGLAMAPAVALGLARFAYALLLPAMRDELGWSFAEAGAMNTANAAGYLAGALVAAPVGRRLGERRAFMVGMLLTTAAIAASGLTVDFAALLVTRFIAGFGGAVAFIAGAGLTAAAAAGGTRSRAPTLLGVYFAGAGIGIAASALAVPSLLAWIGWRGGWLVLGALALAASAIGAAVLPRTPRPATAQAQGDGRWSPHFMACELAAYGMFGAGYIAYATFIVAYLRSGAGFEGISITAFWTLVGLAAVAAAFAWAPVLGALRGGGGAMATMGTLNLGVLLPLLWPTVPGAYLSAILFGGSVLAVIAAVTSFARRAAPPHAWTGAIAALTVAFGIGQCIGPVLSGALSDGPEGVRSGLWLSVGTLLAGVAVAAFQREPTRKS